MDELEIALHDTVFARRSVNGDVGIIEENHLVGLHKGEVVLVDARRLTVA